MFATFVPHFNKHALILSNVIFVHCRKTWNTRSKNVKFTYVAIFLKWLILAKWPPFPETFDHNFFCPTSVILDFQYVILHKTWILTVPNMLVFQFILGSIYFFFFFLLDYMRKFIPLPSCSITPSENSVNVKGCSQNGWSHSMVKWKNNPRSSCQAFLLILTIIPWHSKVCEMFLDSDRMFSYPPSLNICNLVWSSMQLTSFAMFVT